MIQATQWHRIDFSVSGKAGDIKHVSHTPSEDGTLRLFRAERIDATDDSKVPGHGTVVAGVISGNNWRIAPRRPTAAYARPQLSDSCHGTLCHPRLPITVGIEFLEDCAWCGSLIGRVCVVPDEGVYAIVPRSACSSDIPEHRDIPVSNGGDWYEGLELDRYKVAHCQTCWFEYLYHAKWPWRGRDYPIEAVIDPGTREFIITAERRFRAHYIRVEDYPEFGPYAEKERYLATRFRLRAFGAAGRDRELCYAKDARGPWAGFGIGHIPGAVLDPGEQMRFVVENVSSAPLLFKASIIGDEKWQ